MVIIEPYSYVYVMYSAASGLYKIGHSHDPFNRVKQLHRYSSSTIGSGDTTIRLFAAFQFRSAERAKVTERSLQYDFRPYRRVGEWFDFPAPLLNMLMLRLFALSHITKLK